MCGFAAMRPRAAARPAPQLCSTALLRCCQLPVIFWMALLPQLAVGCEWYCKGSCSPGLVVCHRYPCDPENIRACPGSSCERECGGPSVTVPQLPHKQPPRGQSTWVPAVAVSAVLTCCLSRCILRARSGVAKAAAAAAGFLASAESPNLLEAGISRRFSLPNAPPTSTCSNCGEERLICRGGCSDEPPAGHIAVTFKKDRIDRIEAAIAESREERILARGSLAAGTGANSDQGSTCSTGNRASRSDRQTRGEKRRRSRAQAQFALSRDGGAAASREVLAAFAEQRMRRSQRHLGSQCPEGRKRRRESSEDGSCASRGRHRDLSGRLRPSFGQARQADGDAGLGERVGVVEGCAMDSTAASRVVRQCSRSETPSESQKIRDMQRSVEARRESVRELRDLAASSEATEDAFRQVQALDVGLVDDMAALNGVSILGQEDCRRLQSTLSSIKETAEAVDVIRAQLAGHAAGAAPGESSGTFPRSISGCSFAELTQKALSACRASYGE